MVSETLAMVRMNCVNCSSRAHTDRDFESSFECNKEEDEDEDGCGVCSGEGEG